ncbi:MAG: BrnA antitoxin family protein [Alphaproteobacteria bacterium]
MSERRTRRRSPPARKTRTDWARIDALGEAELDAAARADADAQPTDAEFWKSARLVFPERKLPVSLRLDRDVVDWFRAQGRGYQTRINAVLRAYMRAHRKTR